VSLWALSLFAADVTAAPILLAQLQIEQRTIVRVRPVAAAAPSSAKPIKWEEKKGPDCIQMNGLAGALVSSPTSIDIFMRGGVRLRAKLGKSCPSIDFYSGFYVRPTKDGRICEDRDMLHSRSGGECKIDDFKTLVPAK
jgi:hypothetical protein